jgi:2-phospho-L-lactate guanylyltransferase
MAQALLALKDLSQAKTRLAGVLGSTERQSLAQAMAEDVVAVLAAHPDITQITLVSNDPSAAMLARRSGAQCWAESELSCAGLNPLMQRASERLLESVDDVLLVLHADLPLLCADDISAALALQCESGGLVIACDRQGTGTNLLAFDRASTPQFCFGTDSCAEYSERASRAGVPLRMLQRSGIAADVDEPADLDYVMARLHAYPGRRTNALLHRTALGAQVEWALAALSGAARCGR